MATVPLVVYTMPKSPIARGRVSEIRAVAIYSSPGTVAFRSSCVRFVTACER